jgi:hypothetical protein
MTIFCFTGMGNALRHLGEYFASPGKFDLSVPCGSAPYTERLDEVISLGINPNGDVILCSITIGNIYADDILDIIDRYDPYTHPAWRVILTGGIPKLTRYAKERDITADISDCRSACGACRELMGAIGG